MKVKPLLQSINENNFLNQYLTACGVNNVSQYLEANLSSLENPWCYPNMQKGVSRLKQAIDNNEKIGILIDCDCDGYMSAGIIVSFLLNFTDNLIYFFHVGKGHGLIQNKEEDIVQQVIDENVNLLILPDSGTNNSSQCRLLASNNIDVLVLDHHEVTDLHSYAIIINHHLGKELNTALSGAGVTYKFVVSCAESWGFELGDLYYDMVATSIVSDICDLSSLENRVYVKYGFEHITNPLIKLMFTEFNRKGNNSIGVSWGTAPHINSLCRSNNQQAKIDFFMALIGKGDLNKAISIARKAHNKQSKIVKTIYQEIEPELDHNHKVIIGYTTEDYKEYTGLIANKLTGNFNKPSLVLRELNPTIWSGSLRSPVDIADKINESKLAKCQGHLSAAGIVIKKSNLQRLIKWFDNLPLSIETEYKVAGIIKPNQITLPLCHVCSDNMTLWGSSEGSKIIQPKFYLEFETSPNDVQVFVKKTTTVKITKGDVSFLKFQCDDETAQLLQKEKCKVAMIVTLGVNEWNDVESPQGTVESWKVEKVEDEGLNWEDFF